MTLEQGTGAVHTAPGHGQEDYVSGTQVRHRESIVRWMPPAASSTPKAPPEHLPDELIGKTVWEANPIVIEILKAARRAAWPGEDGALLSALLALPQSGDLPRHRAVVHRHGAATISARTRWRPSQRVKWMPTWGEERISNMIAARPDWCISRQRVWGVPIIVFYCEECREPLTDRKILDRIVELFRSTPPTSGTNARPRNCCRPGITCAKCGGTEFSQGDRHSGRVVRFRIEPPGGAQRALRPHLARRHVPGRRRPVSRLVPQFAAGRHGHARAARRIAPARSTAGCWMAKARRCTSRWATPSSRRRSSSITARRFCGCGRPRWISAKTCAFRETILTRLVDAYRKLRNTFRYMLGNLSDFDPQNDDRCRPANCTELDQWILLRAEDLVARCRGWYDELRVSQGLPRGLRFRHGGSERGLLRRAEGPALHLGRRNRKRGAARRPRSIVCWTRWCACWRPS